MGLSGSYGEHTCENPECKEKFTKKSPWQKCCSTGCRNHKTYMKTVLPMRHKLAGKKK